MSDQWGPGAGQGDENEPDEHDEHRQPQFGSAPPPPPPPPPPPGAASLPPLEPMLTLQDETEVKRSSGIGGRTVAAIVGVVLLVGGTLFAVTQVGSSGPGSAEDAVADLIEAASNEDVLGLMAAIDPREREVLRQPIEDMFNELERLEVLDDSFELTGVAGIDLEFEGVTYRTEDIRDGLARVYFTGGTVTSSVNTDELPIGAFVQDTLDRFEADISGMQETETSSLTEDDEAFLVARDTGDGWRVSIGYSIAEAARVDGGLPFPSAALAVEAIGADSPEAAVEGMVSAITDLDIRGMIGRLSPAEFAALHEYAGLFIEDAEAAMGEVPPDFDFSIDQLELRSETSGDRATVFIDGFRLSIEFDGTALQFGYSDGCVTIEGDLEELGAALGELESPICADDLEETYEESMLGFEDVAGFDLPAFPELEIPAIGITTMKVDGQWYVAPVATYLDSLVAVLEVLDRAALDAIVDFVEQVIESFSSAFEESFSDIGTSIGGGQFDRDTGIEGFEDPNRAPSDDQFDDDSFGSTGDVDFDGLDEMLVGIFADDYETQDCMFFELIDADPALVNELIESFRGGPDPSEAAQQLFFDAAAACDAS